LEYQRALAVLHKKKIGMTNCHRCIKKSKYRSKITAIVINNVISKKQVTINRTLNDCIIIYLQVTHEKRTLNHYLFLILLLYLPDRLK